MKISNEDFRHYKPLLFSLGYRMLGTISDTEDLIQETFLRMYEVDEGKVQNIKAYLCKVMTNLCLDFLKSARYKREQYVGEWLPEPLMLENDPAEITIQKEGLSIAYLRMMEHLSPQERAIVILRDFFDFSYREIANIVDKSEPNSRKIYSRAKQKLNDTEKESLHYEQNKTVVNRFVQAIQMQDKDELLKLVSGNITLYSDGGGKVNAAIRPIVSPIKVSAFLTGLAKKIPEDYYLEIKNVNGQPAVLNYMDGGLQSIISFYIDEQQIREIYVTLNPDKLPDIKVEG